MDENVLKKIRLKILSNIEMSNGEFESAKMNADMFKSIKFIKRRKAKKKWLMRKLTRKTKK